MAVTIIAVQVNEELEQCRRVHVVVEKLTFTISITAIT